VNSYVFYTISSCSKFSPFVVKLGKECSAVVEVGK